MYVNGKNFYPINTQIIRDAQMVLTDVGSRCPGSTKLQAGRVEDGGFLVGDAFKMEIIVTSTLKVHYSVSHQVTVID